MAEFIDSKQAKSYTRTSLRTECGPIDTSGHESSTSTGQSVESSNGVPAGSCATMPGSEFNLPKYFDENEAQMCMFHPIPTYLVVSPSTKDEYFCGDCWRRTIAVIEDETLGEWIIRGAYRDGHTYTFPYGPVVPLSDDTGQRKFREEPPEPISLSLEPEAIRDFRELIVTEPNFDLHNLQFKIKCTECSKKNRASEDVERCICKETKTKS
ncbi:hypothetical protein MMC14_002526 [Varicellaria rhodocarpa]|nr:hypothetical protein [Varicellaria rhodocarpa]